MAQKKALLTIVHTEGSTWQKVGARLILKEDGTMDQMLTGGCLEKHLKDSATELCNGERRLLTFDMRDEEDALFGWGSGCGGKMVILVEPHTDLPKKNSIDPCEDILRSFSIEFIDSSLFRRMIYLDRSNSSDLPLGEILYSYAIAPKAKVLIFGAGPDGTRLSESVSKIGFITHLFDHRDSVVHAEKFDPSQVSLILKKHQPDMVVVMTHNFLVDQLILRSLSEQIPLKVLLLGPSERKNALMKDIESAALHDVIEAPLGMIAKARGSEEVALSASASLLDFWKKRIDGEMKKISPELILTNLGYSFSPISSHNKDVPIGNKPDLSSKKTSCNI